MKIAIDERCEFLEECRFFNSPLAQNQQNLIALMDLFCRGEEGMECCRKRFLQATGKTPPDGMLPNGQMLASPATAEAG
ncbi:MAG: hypothetical protein AB7D00_06585 [Rhodospirillaceae bacterium]